MLPCPFCDSAPELFETIDMGWVVECSNCAGNVDRQESAADAADSWNARASRQAEGPSDGTMLRFMAALHSNVPEIDRPGARADYSDDQWCRIVAAFATLATPPASQQREPLSDEALLEIARQYLDTGLSWAPHITRCNDLEIKAFARAVEAALGAQPQEPLSNPTPGLLMSMAIRYDHALAIPGYYDHPFFAKDGITHAQRLESTLRVMRQLWEEVTGNGFYRPEKEAEYAAHGITQKEGAP